MPATQAELQALFHYDPQYPYTPERYLYDAEFITDPYYETLDVHYMPDTWTGCISSSSCAHRRVCRTTWRTGVGTGMWPSRP